MFEEDRSVPLTRLPLAIWAMLIGFTLVPGVLYPWVHGWGAFPDLGLEFFGWLVALTLLHEGIHAVGWKYASGLPWSAFKFGFAWKSLTPYCHAREAMPVGAYRIGSLLPLALTGLLPWAAGMILGDGDLGLAAAVLIGGAAGDVWVFLSIRDLEPGALVRDHPENAGCVVMRPE